MENKHLFLIAAALAIFFVYSTATSLIDNKVSCSQDSDCSLVQTSCCADEKEYSCFEGRYALLLKAQNLKCPFVSNGTCAAEYKAPPECACVQKQCATRERNDTVFKQYQDNFSDSSNTSTGQNEWGN